MCRSVRRAERISLASATLAKASEDVLLAAMIRPRTARASRVAERSDQYWYPANAADVSSKRSEEHTSELQSPCNLVCRLLLEKKKKETSFQNALLDAMNRYL